MVEKAATRRKNEFVARVSSICWKLFHPLLLFKEERRLQIGLELAQQFAGKRLLDYGCYNGRFLAPLMSQPYAPSRAVGAELQQRVVDDCNSRLGSDPRLRFVVLDQLDAMGPFDAVFCTEVLEHVVDKGPVLDHLERLLAPSGKLLISVPVETGLPLLLKPLVRRVAGWQGFGYYPGNAPLTWKEFLASVFAGPRQHIVRPVNREQDGSVRRPGIHPDAG